MSAAPGNDHQQILEKVDQDTATVAAVGTADDLTIGVDVGGTKIGAGVVNAQGEILARVRRQTPAGSVDHTAEVIAEVVKKLRRKYPAVSAVGIGAAGFVAADRAMVRFAPNLAWRDEPLAGRVNELCGLPTIVENDANVVAWAESRFGAAREAESVVALTLGTGIGSGIVFAGQLIRGSYGFAAEVGHLKVVPRGRKCGCGQRGCWERYGSGTALVANARRRVLDRPLAAAAILERANGQEVTGLHVTAAAQAGDPFAQEILTETATWVGIGLADLAAVLDPEVFVIGGGVAEAGDLIIEPLRQAFAKNLSAYAYRRPPRIELATMGQGAGIVGAADLARQRD